jgi:hypothetical protein
MFHCFCLLLFINDSLLPTAAPVFCKAVQVVNPCVYSWLYIPHPSPTTWALTRFSFPLEGLQRRGRLLWAVVSTLCVTMYRHSVTGVQHSLLWTLYAAVRVPRQGAPNVTSLGTAIRNVSSPPNRRRGLCNSINSLVSLRHFKPKVHLSPYLTGSTLSHHYKNQSFNAV